MQIDTINMRGFIVAFALAACSGAAIAQTEAQPTTSIDEAETPATLPAQLHDFDAYVENVREQFDVPGIAVAIVKDGRIVLQRGYGVRERGEPALVDAHTMFAIASNTKAFTAAALQMLADAGKLEMDDRVIKYLPWFRMSDPYVTHEMRIRDLLAHRSGLALGAGDLLYWPTTDYSTQEVARRLRFVPLTGGFRAQYAYDNILFGVAQLVIEEVSGMSYRDFLRTRIFEPLGMHETRFNADYLRPGDNVATGNAKADFTTLVDAKPLTWHNLSGAGGLYSSVQDMARWVRVQLDQGAITSVNGGGEGENAQRLFSEDAQQAMWSMLTPIPIGEPDVPALAPAMPNFHGYAQGWHVSDYRGEKMVWHTGGWPGFVSRVTLLPEHELGVVVLTSAQVGAAFNAITYQAVDAYLDAPATDWISAYAAARAESSNEAEADWQAHLAARDLASNPSLPASAYAGTYRDPWYGDVVISQDDDGLRIQFSHTPQLAGELSHWQNDTFIVRWDERRLNADAFLTFNLGVDGEITGARMEAISPRTDFSFDFHHLRLAPVDNE